MLILLSISCRVMQSGEGLPHLPVNQLKWVRGLHMMASYVWVAHVVLEGTVTGLFKFNVY